MKTARFAAVLVLAIQFGCEHSRPFGPTAPPAVGPPEPEALRRLTFNPAEDRDPVVIGDSIVLFTRLEPDRGDKDRCLAFLPLRTGTLSRTACPGGARADAVLEAWRFAAVSRSDRVAYIREQADPLSFAPWARSLRVAPLAAPENVLVEYNVFYEVFGVQATAARHPIWVGDDRIRLVMGTEDFTLMNGVRDTVFVPLGLGELDVATGEVSEVAGSAGAYAHAPASGGGWWIVTSERPEELRALEPDGTSSVAGRFAGLVTDLAVVDSLPIAALGADSLIEWLDPATGTPVGELRLPGRIRRLAPVVGRRSLVLELETGEGRDLFLAMLP